MHYDVIIIGLGLSGLMAAKTAVEANQKTLLVGKGTGSVCLFSNTIDVLGNISEKGNLQESIFQWVHDHPNHPYAKAGIDRIQASLTSFLSLFPSPYSFGAWGEGNSLILTGSGTRRPTRLLPVTMMAGTRLQPGEALIVGIRGFKDFYASYVADAINGRGVTLAFPDLISREISGVALSRLLEQGPFRKRVALEIKKHLHGETVVGLPAILGLEDPVTVKAGLEKIIGAGVFEIPILPPSIPGRRIFNRFRAWLMKKGVTFLMGHSVSKTSVRGKRCEGIYVLNPPVSAYYTADRFILATGRFMGGGLIAGPEQISEPLFDLPVHQPSSREHWFAASFFDPHPLHQAGVLTNSRLRPVNQQGDLLFDNVWVAGSILSHHQMIQEGSREGIDIATGFMAAQEASL